MTQDTSIDAVIDDRASKGEDFRADPKFAAQMRSNAAGSGSEKDEFAQKLKKAMSSIETVVRPHLKRE